MAEDRRDDWHNSVDARLVNLTSAQKSADADLDKLRRKAERVDLVLRGDPARNIKGLVEAANHLESEINKFNRIFDKDYLGHGGLVTFITYVYERERERQDAARSREGYKWGFWGLILAALIGAAALALTNKEEIKKWWPRDHPAPLEQAIENAKHPRPKRRHYVIRQRPDAEPGQAVPEVPKSGNGAGAE